MTWELSEEVALKRVKLPLCALSALLSSILVSDALADGPVDLSSLKADDAVSVREGDTWSPATFEKKEGRKFQVKYADGTEEWVTADRLKIGAGASAAGATTGGPPSTPTPAPTKPKVPSYPTGSTVEAKDNAFWNPAKVINRRGDWYLLEWTKFGRRREWVEPWRIRKPGSDYDLKGWYTNPRVENGDGPPRPTPGDPTDDRDRPDDGSGSGDKPRKKDDPFGPPDNGVAVTDAVRTGRGVSPVAGDAWAYVPAAGPHFGSIAPTILPPLGEQFARYDILRIVSGNAIMPVEAEFMGKKKSGVVKVEIASNSTAAIEMNPATLALAISPSGQLVAGRSNSFFTGAKNRLDVYKIAARKTTPLISFFPSPAKEKEDVDDAMFVDDKSVLTLSGNELASWDVETATCQWAMPVRGKRLVRSPDGKSIAVGTSDGVALVDPAAGKVLGALDGEPTDDLSFSADAKRLLGISNSLLSVWDLTNGRPVYTMGLPAGVTGTLAAIDSEFALIGPYLFDLEKKCVVWKYETTAPMAAAGGRVFSVLLDNKLRMLVSAALPQPSAAAAAKAAKEAQLVLKPGASIALDLQGDASDEQKAAATAAFTRQLQAGGITVDPAAPIHLLARTESKTSTREYSTHGPFNRGGGENVTLTAKTTTLAITSGDRTLWSLSRTAGNDPGAIVMTRGGETVQQQVDKANSDSAGWIATATIPVLVAAPVDLTTIPVGHWAMGGVKDK